jgi:ketosteroid isomerase-like protein
VLTDQELANRKLAANLLDRYKHNDHDGILALVTEDCVFTIGAGKSQGVVPYHGEHAGHEKIAGYLRKRRTYSDRDECLIKPPVSGAPSPESPPSQNDTDKHATSPTIPLHERLIVQANVVVAIGRLRDRFADGTHMHETDFVIVFQIDEPQQKISSFQYFLDTEAVADAWRHKSHHAAHHAGE